MSEPERRPALRELQAVFFGLVTAREGPAGGLRALGMTPADLGAMVPGDERLDATGRIGIYADMYFHRLLDVLRADYPKLALVLGEDDFGALVADYLVAFRSDDPSVRHLGKRLPGFLSEYSCGAARPWLADLARLEWARITVHDRADAPVLRREQIAGMSGATFAALRLDLVPASTIVDLGSAVDEVWRHPEQPRVEPPRGRRRMLVWRHGNDVLHRAADGPVEPLLPLLARGTTFGELCDRVGEALAVEEAAAFASALLSRLMEDGVLLDTLAE